MKSIPLYLMIGICILSGLACQQAAQTPGTEDTPKATEPVAVPAEPVATETSAEVTIEAPAEVAKETWVSLFNGENLDGMTVRGAATWEVKDGAILGQSPGGQGHLYMGPELVNLEVKGQFKIVDTGGGANSGMYFRANEPADNPDGYPKGYEAQICHNQDAYTGWLWKPGAPTGEATELLTKDGEWFSMRVKAVGTKLEIIVNDKLVMTYEDDEYTKGFFALQCHNDGMTIEAKNLYYRDLGA